MLKNNMDWIKNNKFVTLLILILGFFAFKYFLTFYWRVPQPIPYATSESGIPNAGGGVANKMMATDSFAYVNNVPPQLNVTDRKYITNNSFSLQVKNVTDTIEAIKTKTTEFGGYLVNVYVNRPEFGEDATLEVRVPNDKLDQLTAFLRQNAIKVVSENISKSDITDQYVDVQERLKQLNDQKAALLVLMKSAKTVDEIIQVKPYLDQIQNEIDSYTGQIKYLEGASASTLVTIYLATDEIGLPYTPAEAWRPQAIFKQATRALILTIQQLGTAAIWLGVYSVIIIPVLTVLVIIMMVRRRHRQ